MKEQSSQSGSDMKSLIAIQSPAESVASQHIQSDVSEVSYRSIIGDELMDEIEYLDELQNKRDE